MHLLFHLFRKILPLGLIAGVGFISFASFAPVISDRVESFGVNAIPADSSQSSLAMIPSEPALLTRVTLDWSAIEPAQGEYNWSGSNGLDLQVAALAAQQRTIIGVLNGGPVYLVSSMDNPVDQTQLLLRWAAFVQAAVDRYGDQIHIWEIGAAINTPSGISPFLYPQNPHTQINPDPVLYAKLVKTASTVIKTTNPNAEVWTGSMVGFTSARCAMNPLTYLLELHGAKAWGALDGIEFDPDRGSTSPETASPVNPRCASSLSIADTSLKGETQAVQELIRQLGDKLFRVSGLGWSADELAPLLVSRSISQEQLLADLLTRASVPLLAQNGVTSLIWSIDPAANSASARALTNLESLLVGAVPVGQTQGNDGSIQEYRFQKADQTIIVVWRAVDGDTAAPVNLSNLQVKKLYAFPVDAASFSNNDGTLIPVNGNGEALLMVNERPVVLIGRTADITIGIKQDVQNIIGLGQLEVKQSLRRLANSQKAAIRQWIASLFDSAKDQAINWGEEKLNEILN